MTCEDNCLCYEVCERKTEECSYMIDGQLEYDQMQNWDWSNMKEHCGYFKDKSKFIELPCKVGDVVYLVSMQKITVDVVTRIKFVDKQNLIGRKRISIGGEKFSIYDDDFGRIAFTEKPKAEAKLKELNENA